MARGHIQNIKITKKHTSSIEAVTSVVEYLLTQGDVDKISLGIIKSLKNTRKSAQKSIKVRVEKTGILVTVTQKISVQEFRIYSKDLDKVSRSIQFFAAEQKWAFRSK